MVYFVPEDCPSDLKINCAMICGSGYDYHIVFCKYCSAVMMVPQLESAKKVKNHFSHGRTALVMLPYKSVNSHDMSVSHTKA